MGSQESKIQQSPAKENIQETSLIETVPSSPILTPLDPRSPSANIARTPLNVVLPTKDQISGGELEENNEDSKEIVNVVLGVDPRSPTVEFNRTPIIVGTVNKAKTKLHNKNLENVLKSEIHVTPILTAKKLNPEKLTANSNKRKSFVGLLETNIDFTETDLDAVCQAKDLLNKTLPTEMNDDLPCNKLKEQMEVLQLEIDSNKVISDTSEEDKEVEIVSEQIVEVEKVEEKVNITAQVKDFDKKLTHLIYEDNSEDESKPNFKIIKVKENNRTPLSIRNSNDEPRKSTNRLKVSDKPRKSDVSRIPVLKDHKKIGIQCENTPPKKYEETTIKHKVSHWDTDKSLII